MRKIKLGNYYYTFFLNSKKQKIIDSCCIMASCVVGCCLGNYLYSILF